MLICLFKILQTTFVSCCCVPMILLCMFDIVDGLFIVFTNSLFSLCELANYSSDIYLLDIGITKNHFRAMFYNPIKS